MKSLFVTIFFLFTVSFICYSQEISKEEDERDLIKLYLLGGQENVGRNLTEFRLRDLTNNIFTSDDLKGKITFVNFWFEACHPCMTEFETLNELYVKYKGNKDFQFISFTFETKENAERVAREHAIEYPILLTSYDSCASILNSQQGYPTNMILDKEGKVRVVSVGGPIKVEAVQKKFEIVFFRALDKLLK